MARGHGCLHSPQCTDVPTHLRARPHHSVQRQTRVCSGPLAVLVQSGVTRLPQDARSLDAAGSPSSPGTSKKGAWAGAQLGPSLPTGGSCASKQSSAASPASVSLVSVGVRVALADVWWADAVTGPGGCLSPVGQACRAGGPGSRRKPLPWVGGPREAGWDCAPGGAASGPADARCGASPSWGTSQGTGQVDGQQDLPGAHRAHCPPRPHAPVPTQGWPPGTGTRVPQRPGRGRPVFSSQGVTALRVSSQQGLEELLGGGRGAHQGGGVPPQASPPTAQS